MRSALGIIKVCQQDTIVYNSATREALSLKFEMVSALGEVTI